MTAATHGPISLWSNAHRSPNVVVTHHACERAVQRHGFRSLAQARTALEDGFAGSVKLPRRYAGELSPGLRAGRRAVGPRMEVRVAGSMLLVCRNRTVVTTWRLTDDQLATVAWYCLTRCWLGQDRGPQALSGRDHPRPPPAASASRR